MRNTVKSWIMLSFAAFMMLGCNGKSENKAADVDQPAPEGAAKQDEAKQDEAKQDGAKQDEAKQDEAKQDGAKQADDAAPEAEAQKAAAPIPQDDSMRAQVAPTGLGVKCEEAEGCDCGETKCPMNGVCTDGVCKCGETLVDSTYTGYSCWEIAKDRYDLGCTETDGCPCGKIKVYSNMGCSGTYGTCAGSPVPGRGLSCKHKPYGDFYYSLVCFKDECDCYGTTINKGDVCAPLECENGFKPSILGCACDGRRFDENYLCVPSKENKFVNYCNNPDGCECGENTCPAGAVCRRDKCVDRTTLKDLPEGFEVYKGVPKCTGDECVCHKAKCKTGKYCLNAYCYNDPYFRKIDGKTYYFRILGGDDLADAGENEKYRMQLWDLLFLDETMPICARYASVYVKGNDADLCQSDDFKNKTIAEALTHCGTADIPENVGDLYCTFGIRNGALELSGWEN